MKRISLVLFCLLSLPLYTMAQELDATVIVNVEQLDAASRGRLENFSNQLRDYLNNTKFRSKAWQGEKIKCTFNVFFNSSSDVGSYSVQLVVTSQRIIEGTPLNSLMMSIMDNTWNFLYQKNQAMYFNQTDFDPLTSFLDFYANLIIGFDLDSYYSLGGTDNFQKCLEIAVKGASSAFNKGWQMESTAYNRRALASNLLDAKYQQFRLDYYDYHYNGLDLFHDPAAREKALQNMIKIIKGLEKVRDQIDTRSVLLKVFYDAKANEFAEYFKALSDKSIFTTLKKIDPSHATKYEEALK